MKDTKELTFKEALIAHLRGEKVEVYSIFTAYDGVSCPREWREFGKYYASLQLGDVNLRSPVDDNKYRLAPSTIMCNGVEVPAPEKVAPVEGTECYVPDIYANKWTYKYTYRAESDLHKSILERGLLYLNEEDALARAKAMLIVKEV